MRRYLVVCQIEVPDYVGPERVDEMMVDLLSSSIAVGGAMVAVGEINTELERVEQEDDDDR